MTTTDNRFTIHKGPSREQLFDALRLFHEQREVHFVFHGVVAIDKRVTASCEYGVKTLVRSIEAQEEDGWSADEPEKWLVKVQIVGQTAAPLPVRKDDVVIFLYDSRCRKGHIVS